MLGLESLKGTVFLCILKTEELPTVSASGTIAKLAEIIWCFLPRALRSPYIPISLLCLRLDVQASFRKRRGTRDQIANIRWIIEKAREFQKNIYFCFIDYAKAFDCVDHNKLWKILKEKILTCLLRNLYAGQEATVTTGHGTTDWFQIGKGVCQGCILPPCLFNLYAEYIKRNARLNEALESRLPGEI